MIEVNEFITYLDQGYANAFLCRCKDTHKYVVKSRRSGKESLIREWVCGRIGRELGLPIPSIEFVYAPRSVAEHSANREMAALADTPGFGSQFIGSPTPDGLLALPLLNVADVIEVDPAVRRRVLLFDWWVLNFDRTDENPNLLWNPIDKAIHVIDHNLAFDPHPPDLFWTHHIFRSDRAALSDARERAIDVERMEAIVGQLPLFWSEMPESWLEVSDLSVAAVDTILRRCESDDFWCPP
jgi:hypothetical protein